MGEDKNGGDCLSDKAKSTTVTVSVSARMEQADAFKLLDIMKKNLESMTLNHVEVRQYRPARGY
jgi:hypothetical protein